MDRCKEKAFAKSTATDHVPEYMLICLSKDTACGTQHQSWSFLTGCLTNNCHCKPYMCLLHWPIVVLKRDVFVCVCFGVCVFLPVLV